jgi:hypothetical protein
MASALRPLDRCLRTLAPCVILVSFCLGCNKAGPGAEGADSSGARRSTEIVHEECDLASSSAERLDANGDGRADITIVRENGREICDEIALYSGGVVIEKHRSTSGLGQLDTWEFYKNGTLARTERDSDGDERVDQWWEYGDNGCPMMHSDANRDGKPDVGTTIDYCKETGYVPPERQDYRQATSPDFQRTEALPTETEVQEGEPPSDATKKPEEP